MWEFTSWRLIPTASLGKFLLFPSPTQPSRKDELKAQGVDPNSLQDSDHHKTRIRTGLLHTLLSTTPEQTVEQPAGVKGDNNPSRDTGSKERNKDSGVSWQQDKRIDVPVNDRDLPSSTPVAPSLNIPIVTRTSRGVEVHQLFDERKSTNRVSESHLPLTTLSVNLFRSLSGRLHASVQWLVRNYLCQMVGYFHFHKLTWDTVQKKFSRAHFREHVVYMRHTHFGQPISRVLSTLCMVLGLTNLAKITR